MIKYVVQIKRYSQPCWLTSGQGEPSRTLCIESATQFKSEESALHPNLLPLFGLERKNLRGVERLITKIDKQIKVGKPQ